MVTRRHKRKVKPKRKRRKISLKKPFKPMPKVIHLPIETSVFVPSTRLNRRIPSSEHNKRINETRKKLSNLLGGYTSVSGIGGFTDHKGRLIKEPIVKVTAFGTRKEYLKNRKKYLFWLIKKKKEWKQESIGYEYEGDLYFI